ncbi:uncharacterized protein B0H64DRAFT_390098 [Chaetomium fimeti]|uniref:Aminoglycoside phosphotransferase domain-containing protein n=1 Tax=Chaetomium fimeti TaxID=1854472 RepID=A0AAE0HHS6_9PEZI|nr:hypothetical protein B0H64DRAFT_390098 [Chaetomium fimeti]
MRRQYNPQGVGRGLPLLPLGTPLRETHDVLTVVRPTKFHVPPVIYHTSRHGWECTIIGQVQGRALEFAIMDVAGGGVGWIEDSTSPVHVAEVTRICTRVADQVVDAVVEMSQCTESKVCGLDRKASPDPHFANIGTAGDEVLSLEEVARNCKDAGMDPCDTVLGPGNLSAENIMLDKDGNFVGFSGLLWAGYAPRSWVQLGMIDPSDSSAADLRAYTCALPGPRGVKPGPGDSILLLWQKILSEKLASKGFPKLDAYRLRWLRRQKTVTDDLERTEE